MQMLPLSTEATLTQRWEEKNMPMLYEEEHPAAHSPMVAVLFWTSNHWAYIVHISIFSITLFWETEACTEDFFQHD